jgi:hypothetical protein
MAGLTPAQELELAKALTLTRQRRASLTGAEAMRARGLSSDPAATAEMNAQAETAMQPQRSIADRVGQFGAGVFEGYQPILAASPFGSMTVNRIMAHQAGETAEKIGVPADETERRLRTAGEYIGPSVPFGAGGILSGALSGAAAGEVRERGGGPGVEAIAAILAGGVPTAIANKASKAGQVKAAINAVPDIDDLKVRAGALYDAGKATGATALPSATQGLQDDLTRVATANGLISPSGALAPDYPKIGHALKMAQDYASQPMGPEQMQQVRRALQAAAQSADANEARIGTKMLREFDTSIRNPLVPEFAEGDKLYSRAMRGEEIKEAIDIAQKGRRTANVNALSNEFQNLVRKGIRGDLTYPPELQAAVEQTANGTTGRQLAEGVGKLSPTGAVPLIGNMSAAGLAAQVGGLPAAAAVGGASTGTGLIARLLANRMARGDARAAMATALNGAPLPAPETSESVRAAIAALLANQALKLQQ